MAKKPKHKTEAVVLANSIKTIGKMVHIKKTSKKTYYFVYILKTYLARYGEQGLQSS